MDPAFRKDRQKTASLLAEDFCEFGSSGRVWSREAILEHLAEEAPQPAPKVVDFQLELIAPMLALVTYRTIRSGKAALRSSLWIEIDGEWKIRFHQGTPIPSQCSDSI